MKTKIEYLQNEYGLTQEQAQLFVDNGIYPEDIEANEDLVDLGFPNSLDILDSEIES